MYEGVRRGRDREKDRLTDRDRQTDIGILNARIELKKNDLLIHQGF